MFKPLALTLTTIAASATSLAGCPPPEQPATPACEVSVQLVNEPSKDYVAQIPADCKVNIFMTPYKEHGMWPWRRCVTYWGGTFVDTGITYFCEDIDH